MLIVKNSLFFMVDQCFFVKIRTRHCSFGNLPDPLAKPLDHGSDLHSLDAHAWSDAEENRSLSLSAGSERFFRRARQKQDDSLKGPLPENILKCFVGQAAGRAHLWALFKNLIEGCMSRADSRHWSQEDTNLDSNKGWRQ